MASSQPPSGAEAIRSLQADNAVFHAFDSYPWTKDPAFLSGLRAILGDPANPSPSSSPSDLAIHARIFYYAQRIGVNIDLSRYLAWLSARPDHVPPQVLPEEYRPGSNPAEDAAAAPSSSSSPPAEETPLSWQTAAPKKDLFIDKSALDASQSPDANAARGEPNYPMGFAEMLRLLQEGKPIPGIRQIPNNIARDATTKPVGTRPAPRKPWETHTKPQSHTGGLHASLDADFPPVDTDGEPQAPQAT